MKILVVGGGGREHALCWKLAQSPLADEVICAPGNAGIATVARCMPTAAEDVAGILALAKDEQVGLVVVGPEQPLCDGLVDALEAEGIKAFGPSKQAAEIEGSKAFARRICARNRVPQPGFWVFDDLANAMGFLENRPEGPLVVKASGLAAGKGVVIAADRGETETALRACLEGKKFGASGATVVLEECIEGPEVSVLCLTDGKTIVPFETAGDSKRLLDGDEGPNTGGMGAVSPVRGVYGRIFEQIEDKILLQTVHAMNREGRPFKGILYAGIMLTAAGPRVLEFNCRFGDPETQPLLMRMQSDLLPLLLATVDGELENQEAPTWDPRAALCVMAASGGYPGSYRKGVPIQGLDQVETGPDLQVFHSGTSKRPDGSVVTAGGRVLATCALGADASEARQRAYGAMEKIQFSDMHYRKDIVPR